MNDRIRLAERVKLARAMGNHSAPSTIEIRFDPFVDANDDYAVLEWMRRLDHDVLTPELMSDQDNWDTFTLALPDCPHEYLIGDYARAALKVIDDEQRKS